jgi:uncharacterized protein YcbX
MALKIEALTLYPIKSCGKLNVSHFQIGAAGPELILKEAVIGDRQWMFVDADGKFVTQRAHPQMALMQPQVEADRFYLQVGPERFEIPLKDSNSKDRKTVSIWGKAVDARSASKDIAQAASQFLKIPVDFVFYDEKSEREVLLKGRGLGVQTRFTDTQPYLVLSTESLKDLNSRMKDPIEADRFRGNILLSGAGKAFAEDQWQSLRNDEVVFESTKGCGRCKIITVDPKTGAIPNSEPLKVLAQFRRRETNVFFGQYFLSHSFGKTISVGDSLEAD